MAVLRSNSRLVSGEKIYRNSRGFPELWAGYHAGLVHAVTKGPEQVKSVQIMSSNMVITQTQVKDTKQ